MAGRPSVRSKQISLLGKLLDSKSLEGGAKAYCVLAAVIFSPSTYLLPNVADPSVAARHTLEHSIAAVGQTTDTRLTR